MKKLFFGFAALSFLALLPTNAELSAKTLEVQAVSHSGTLPSNGVRIPVVYLNLRTSEDPITLKSVTLSRSGLSSSEDIGRVWLQKEYSRLSRARQFTNDDQLTLEFTKDYVIPANTTDRIYVLANLQFTGSGRTLKINLEGIESDANFADPVQNPTVRVKTTAPVRTPGVFTSSRRQHDRSQYKVQCKNSRCSLVKR